MLFLKTWHTSLAHTPATLSQFLFAKALDATSQAAADVARDTIKCDYYNMQSFADHNRVPVDAGSLCTYTVEVLTAYK